MAAEEEVGSLAVSVSLTTAEFNKGIASMNKQMQIVGQEFRNASGGLDKVGDASEIAALRIESLTKKIDLQQGIVDQFSLAHQRAIEKFGEGSKQALDYELKLRRAEGTLQSMQRELASTTSELERLGESTEQSGSDFGEFGEKLKGMGAMAAAGVLAIGAAFVGMVGLGVKTSDELQDALDDVQASTGAADEGMASMKETMLAIYNNNFGESFADIGASMGVITQQTGLTGEALQTATENALALRDTFGMEVTDSIRTVDMMMKQFGISGDEAFNLIAQGAQAGLDKNGNLLDSINEYSIHFEQLGFDGEEMFNMMANGARAGVFDVDKLGDAMKEFGIRSKDASDSSAAGFAALGLDATEMTTAFNEGGEAGKEAFGKVTKALFEMDDLTAQNMTGVALFGTQWEDVGVKGVKSLVDTQGAISTTVDALGKINEVKYNSFGESVEGIKRQLITGIVLPLGDEVLPKMNEFGNYLKTDLPSIIEGIKPVISGLIESIEFLADNFKIITPLVAGFAAGFVAYEIIGTVSGLVSAFRIATEGATIAQWAMNVAMSANPIGLAVIAIAAVVAAGVALWMNWDTISAKATEVFTAIKTTISESVNWIINLFTVTIPESITLMVEFFSALPGEIVKIFNGVMDGISKWGKSVGSWVSTNVPKFIDAIVKFFDQLPGKIGYALGFALGTMAKWGVDSVAWVATNIPILISNIVTFFSGLPGKLAAEFTKAVTELGKWGTNSKNWVTTNVPVLISSIVSFFAGLPGKLATEFTKVVGEVSKWIGNMKAKVSSEIPKVVSSITGFFDDLPGDMADIGDNLVKGLWNGINGAASWLKNMISNFAESIIDGFKAAFGIESPSKKTMEIGGYLGEGLAIGMENQSGRVGTAAMSMASGILGLSRLSPKVNTQTGGSAITGNQSVPGGNQAPSGQINISLLLDGKTVAQVIAPHQYQNQRGRSRGQGALA